jgi:L,D-peptidoglycan transpeptidase YkuD (ErfK/YbiS/YcfS/YnhG family)
MKPTIALVALAVAAGCQPAAAPDAGRQFVNVRRDGAAPRAVLTAGTLRNGRPVQELGPWPAVVGRHGIAPFGQKREGDGRTPGGAFTFGTAFGSADRCDTGLPYRQATAHDFWIDDPASPDYNRWIRGNPPDVSHERLRRDDGQYELAVVIEYNTIPVVPGRGSAIFLHVWAGPDEPTSGCIALAKDHVQKLLAWMSVDGRPVITITP